MKHIYINTHSPGYGALITNTSHTGLSLVAWLLLSYCSIKMNHDVNNNTIPAQRWLVHTDYNPAHNSVLKTVVLCCEPVTMTTYMIETKFFKGKLLTSS